MYPFYMANISAFLKRKSKTLNTDLDSHNTKAAPALDLTFGQFGSIVKLQSTNIGM